MVYVADDEKDDTLLSTIRRQPAVATLIFVQELDRAEKISGFLSARGHPALVMSDNMSRAFGVINWLLVVPDTSHGKTPLLPRTDCVINYDCPVNLDQYIYRTSLVDSKSTANLAITFFNNNNSEFAPELVNLLEQAGQRIPAFLRRHPQVPLSAEFRRENTGNTIPDRTMLDPRYKVRTGEECKAFFVPGRVLSVILFSSMDAQSPKSIQAAAKRSLFDPEGEPIHSPQRRMIVFQPRQGYSVCIPISTYDKAGIASKRSLGAKEQQAHAIVYAEGSEVPVSLEGEPLFEKQPIAVRLRKDQILSPSTCIHFDKYHTIEHNVKVMDVGRVAKESMPAFEAYCREELLRK